MEVEEATHSYHHSPYRSKKISGLPASTHQILVVEDEIFLADELDDYLRAFGYSTIGPVSTGEEAILIAKKEKPDLVLLDIGLAGKLDGIEAAKEIHAELNIPVVFLTAHADDKTLERAQITEPYGYILKPFSELELRTAVKLALLRAAGISQNKSNARQPVTAFKANVQQQNKNGDIADSLRQVPYISSLEDDMLLALASHVRREEVKEGKVLILEEDQNVPGFIVLTGRLAMVKSSISGRDFTVELLPAGDPFGLGVALAWDPYPVTVKAQTDSVVLWIPRDKAIELFEAFPAFARELTKDVFNRLRFAHEISRGLAHDRTDIRVATALLALLPRFGDLVGLDPELPKNCITMTRHELADYIGCATETVIRVTKAMERDGLLDLSIRGKIRILDLESLRDMVGMDF